MNVPRTWRTIATTGAAVVTALALSAGQSAAGERCIQVRGSEERTEQAGSFLAGLPPMPSSGAGWRPR